jgi:uncharacterized protein YutE (UPF0331/DUF86 family)
MVDLSRTIEAEKENIGRVLNDLALVMDRQSKSVIELAAIGVFLHNIYNGIENILKQIMKSENQDIFKTETWHKDLLRISSEKGIIDDELEEKLYGYLSFRHFFVHGYGFMLKEEQLMILANGIDDVWKSFIKSIENYRKQF